MSTVRPHCESPQGRDFAAFSNAALEEYFWSAAPADCAIFGDFR
jgi:hypothetical protein